MGNNFQELVELFTKKKLTLSSVESMTCGGFASMVASIPGASKIFMGAMATYSKDVKIKLGVKKETIDKYDVVSKEVALEMADKGKEYFQTDYCISITGNAGPSKEIGKADVGEAYIAIANKEKTIVKKLKLDGERNQIRSKAVEEMAKSLLEICK